MKPTDLLVRLPDGRVQFRLHPGQSRAWRSQKRVVCVLSGTQGGKTAMGPPWLYDEIRRRGPGDYLVVAPSYPLLAKKVLPEFLRLFGPRTLDLGKYNSQEKIFQVSDPGARRLFANRATDVPVKVFFGHASDPESLESATAKAAWLDEAGQGRFRLGSWEAINRRLAVHQGRILITTTPYNLGWLKQKIHDPWMAARTLPGGHPEIDVIRFDSTQNPAFPPEEFERARRMLPRWKFDLFYRAIFSRPAGMIYDCFDPEIHVIPRFHIPSTWPRHVGLDFGPTNTAAVFLCQEQGPQNTPTGRLICYRTYHPGKLTPEQHVRNILEDEPCVPRCVGGSPGEHEWRLRFRDAGLPVAEPPFRDVEAGIDSVYATILSGQLILFDDVEDLEDELLSYARETDDAGIVGAKIEAKATYHLADALRYAVAALKGRVRLASSTPAGPGPANRSLLSQMPAGVSASDW